jgi:diguanylate cyclase (GGDEF)-like protein
MQLVADRVSSLCGADGAIVELAEGREMIYRACSGTAAPFLGLRLDRAASLSGMCVEMGEVLICEDSESDDRVDREACRRVGLRSMVVAPLLYESNAVGVIKVLSARPFAFESGHVAALRTMADLIAAAMYHASASAESELFFRATHDPMTGLANRALFHDRLREAIAAASRNHARFAVLIVDMDGLKQMNDQWGHRLGDAAIKECAVRLRAFTREGDTVARLGGDEFGVILRDSGSPDQVATVVSRLALSLAALFKFEDLDLNVAGSVGSARYPVDGDNVATLIDVADRSMYASKRERGAGRSRA